MTLFFAEQTRNSPFQRSTMMSLNSIIASLNSTVPAVVSQTLDQLPAYAIINPQDSGHILDHLYELYVVSEGSLINIILSCVRKIVILLADDRQTFLELLPRALKILFSTTTHPMYDVILYSVQSIRMLIPFAPQEIFDAMCTFMNSYQSPDEVRSSPKLSILALLPYFYVKPDAQAKLPQNSITSTDITDAKTTELIKTIVQEVTFTEGIAPIADGVLSLCEVYGPIFLSSIPKYFEDKIEALQKKLFNIPSKTDLYGEEVHFRMKTGDFLLNYSDDERQVYLLGLSGRIDFTHIINLFFKQLISADFVLDNYLTSIYTKNLMKRLQGSLKDDLVPTLSTPSLKIPYENADLLTSILHSLTVIVVVQPCHVGAYLLLIALIFEAVDRPTVTKEIIMETVVYLAVNLQHQLAANLSIEPNSSIAMARDKHHSKEQNQLLLDVILSITIKIINLCKEIESQQNISDRPREIVSPTLILHVTRVLGCMRSFLDAQYNLSLLTTEVLKNTMTLINQTAITVCTVPREIISQISNYLNMEAKLSQSDPTESNQLYSSHQHIIISNCSLITYMSGAPITKMTKLLLVELVYQIDQLLGYFVKEHAMNTTEDFISLCIEAILPFTVTPNYALARYFAFHVLESYKSHIPLNILPFVKYGLFDPSWRVRLATWRILARHNFSDLINMYDPAIPENLLLESNDLIMNRDCLSTIPISIILWCYDSVAVVRDSCVQAFSEWVLKVFDTDAGLFNPQFPNPSSPDAGKLDAYLRPKVYDAVCLTVNKLIHMCDHLLTSLRYYYRAVAVEVLFCAYRILSEVINSINNRFSKSIKALEPKMQELNDALQRVISFLVITAKTDSQNVKYVMISTMADCYKDRQLETVVNTLKLDQTVSQEALRVFE